MILKGKDWAYYESLSRLKREQVTRYWRQLD